MRLIFLFTVAAAAGCTTSRLPDPDALMFARLDTDGSGVLTGEELAGIATPDLRGLDTNQDGGVDARELATYLSRPPHGVLRMRAHQRGKIRRVQRPPPKAEMDPSDPSPEHQPLRHPEPVQAHPDDG